MRDLFLERSDAMRKVARVLTMKWLNCIDPTVFSFYLPLPIIKSVRNTSKLFRPLHFTFLTIPY